jgi:hypothetical protein
MTAYTDFVKKYAAEHKLSYKDAMKAASASYKESVGKGVVSPVEVPVEVPVAVEIVSKPKKIRVSKAKGIVTKMLDEDAGGAQHIYPLDVAKVLKMA